MKKDISSVYFLKHKTLNPIKIGHSKDSNPYRRVNSYLTYAPFGIEYIGYIEVYGKQNSILIEKRIHKYFKEFKINREWFDIDIADLIEYLNNNNFNLIQKKHTIKKSKTKEILDYYLKYRNVKNTSLKFNVSIQYVYRLIHKNTKNGI